MVSVVVVAYNVERYIKRCIDSVRMQTYEELDIIIVDSGSTDYTSTVCQEYAQCDERITYVKKTAEGPGPARTVGLHLAKGKYITFVDGDDWLEIDAIEEMVRVSESGNADIVLGDILYVYEQGYDISSHKPVKKEIYSKIRWDDHDASIINKCRTFTWGKLYRREFLIENDFKQGTYAYEDVATIPVIVAKANKIGYINKPVYNYLRNRPTSLVNDKTKVGDMLVALKELYINFNQLGNYQLYENELKRLIWGQIRFICIKHSESMAVGKSGMALYRELLAFVQESFPGFVPPDECRIKLVNGDKEYKLLNNLLIKKDAFDEVIDNENLKKRIVVESEDFVREYDLTNVRSEDIEDESNIWNIVDDIFNNIWC